MFHGPVRVPDDADDGLATVTISFERWPEGRVAPTTVSLPLAPAEPGAKE